MVDRQESSSERMTIRGRLDSHAFVPWIRRHAAKLGLFPDILHADAQRIELDVEGPIDLIDMMEVGCSLGPIEVWVEAIDRGPADRSSAFRSRLQSKRHGQLAGGVKPAGSFVEASPQVRSICAWARPVAAERLVPSIRVRNR